MAIQEDAKVCQMSTFLRQKKIPCRLTEKMRLHSSYIDDDSDDDDDDDKTTTTTMTVTIIL